MPGASTAIMCDREHTPASGKSILSLTLGSPRMMLAGKKVMPPLE
jgi:hypothetical protein